MRVYIAVKAKKRKGVYSMRKNKQKDEKQPSARQTLHLYGRSVHMAMPHWFLMTFGSIFHVGQAFFFSLINGILMRMVLQAAIANINIWNNIGQAYGLLLLVLFMVMIGVLSNSWAGQRIKDRIQLHMTTHMMKADENYSREHHSGDAMSRMISDVNTMGGLYDMGFSWQVVAPILNGVASLVTICVISPWMALLSLGCGMGSMLVTLSFSKAIGKHSAQMQENTGKMASVFSDLLAGALPVRLFGLGKRKSQEYEVACKSVTHEVLINSRYERIIAMANTVFNTIGVVGCLWLAVTLSQRGLMNAADVMIVLPMQGNLSWMLGALGGAWNTVTRCTAASARVLEALEAPEEAERADKGTLRPQNDHMLAFDHVAYRYREDVPVFTDLSLQVPQGQTVALVGESGSGKSTLFQIALGFFQPQEGQVHMLGARNDSCSLTDWRSHIAFVQQEAPLFDRTIGENIALGASGRGVVASREDIEAAAQAANAHSFIQELPQGYDTPVGELGNRLSGGQRQRIAIARAFMSKAPLLLLDEPTSALDAESEALVQQALNRLMEGRTVLVAAHRLSTVRDADKIVVLGGGKVLEEGSHEELLARDGEYARLYHVQFETLAG